MEYTRLVLSSCINGRTIKLGFIPWLSKLIAQGLNGFSWPIVLVLLILFYFYSHYLFASATAHVSAMYAALLGVAVASCTAIIQCINVRFFGNLLASTTHYSSGPAPILYAAGYVTKALVDYEYCTWYSLFYYLDWCRFTMDETHWYDVMLEF